MKKKHAEHTILAIRRFLRYPQPGRFLMDIQVINKFISAITARNIHVISELSSGDAVLERLEAFFSNLQNGQIQCMKPTIGEGCSHLPYEIVDENGISAGKGLIQLILDSGKIRDCVFYREDVVTKTAKKASEPGVTGIGGLFLQSSNPSDLAAWYQKHLAIEFGSATYSLLKWRERERPFLPATTTFAFFAGDSNYFAPSKKEFMINFRVKHLEELLSVLEEAGVTQTAPMETLEYGKFAWIMDPDGNKIELWEPVDAPLEAYEDEK